MRPSPFPCLLFAALLIGCSDRTNPGGPTEPGIADSTGDSTGADSAGPALGEKPAGSGFTEILLDSQRLPKPWGKALGDIDGDGKPDALVGTLDGPIYWYRYPSWERALLAESHGGDDLEVGDIDGDGRLDVVTNGSVIAWYRNPGGAGITGPWERHILKGDRGSHDLVIVDVDRDGRLDVAARVENGPTYIFFQAGAGKWDTRELHRAGGGTGLAVGDIDGDGRKDVAENGYWLRQPENPREGEWERTEIADWDVTSAVGIADMNGDGKGDVFLSRGHGNGRMSWFEAPEDPVTGGWKEHFIDEAGYVHRFHLVDLDGDKDLDLVFAEQQEAPRKRVGIFLNGNGSGTAWSYRGISDIGSHNIAVADIGSDGDWDVLGADWKDDTRPRLWIKAGPEAIAPRSMGPER